MKMIIFGLAAISIFWLFLEHAKDQSKLSPSEIIKITYLSKGNFKSESVYQNDGRPVSGSSVGAVYKNKLLVGLGL